MNAVRDRLNQRAATFDPDEHAYEKVIRKADRRRLVRRMSAIVTATVITCVAFAGLWAVEHPLTSPAGNATVSLPPSTSNLRPSPTPLLPYDGLKVARRTPANGWVVLPDPFGIWVAGWGILTRIDPETGDVRVTAHGGWDYDYVHLAEYGEGTIFVASETTLLEMDAASGTVIARIDLSSLGYIDSVLQWKDTWVTASGDDGSQVLAEIDPDTGKVLQRIDGIGQGVHRLAHAGGYLFVETMAYTGPALLRVDPPTGEVTPVPGGPVGASIVGVGWHLWMTPSLELGASEDGVQCMDASTLQTCGNVPISTPIQLASDGRNVWVLSDAASRSAGDSNADHASVTLIDGTNGNALAGPLPLPGNPSSIAAFDGRAWVGYYNSGTVIELDRT
jgi:hypothetical protein